MTLSKSWYEEAGLFLPGGLPRGFLSFAGPPASDVATFLLFFATAVALSLLFSEPLAPSSTALS